MRRNLLLVAVASVMALDAFGAASARAAAAERYVVVLAGQQGDGGFELAGTSQAVLSLVQSAGGTVTADLTRQVGVLVVESSNALFADLLRGSTLVEEVGEDFVWKAFLSYQEAVASGALVNPEAGGGGPEQTTDPFESQQWSMMQIRAPDAHDIQAGWRAVDVGILDSGIDGDHLDFDDDGVPGGTTNVDCARGRDFVPWALDWATRTPAWTTASTARTWPGSLRRRRTTSVSWAWRRTSHWSR